MADRLTQLQDAVNQQAENFCNSIGILQQVATSSKFPGSGGTASNVSSSTSLGTSSSSSTLLSQSSSHTGISTCSTVLLNEDYTLTFASMIARCAKDIDYLIESLPSEDSSTELQLASLRRLEQENSEAALRLREIIGRGEALLERVQSALGDISQSQIDMQKLETDSTSQGPSLKSHPFSVLG